MHQETELIVRAIESLRQEPSYFKDYIFPIASAFFTSLLGGVIAYFTLRHQENIQIEKEKMNSANKWILLAEEARSKLLAIKENYHGKLTDNPMQRVAVIPSILLQAEPIRESIQDLSFIVPTADKNLSECPKWGHILRIRIMIDNYNYLLKLWDQRNEIIQPIKEQLLSHYPERAYVNLPKEDVKISIGASQLSNLIDMTERIVKLMDDVLIELDDFLSEFPKYAKGKINLKQLKKYGSVLTCSTNGNKKLLALLERTPSANFETVKDLFGMSPEELNKRYSSGYIQEP